MRLLFLGTLTWEPNVSGIEWFLDEVYPKLNDVRLVIAGKGISEHLREKALAAGAKVLGYVEDVNDVYDNCDVMIVPLFMGSGQRVKIIEAFSKGMPVITTSTGVEGLHYRDGENVVKANSARDFVAAVARLKDDKFYNHIACAARATYISHYSIDTTKQMINNVIESTMQ